MWQIAPDSDSKTDTSRYITVAIAQTQLDESCEENSWMAKHTTAPNETNKGGFEIDRVARVHQVLDKFCGENSDVIFNALSIIISKNGSWYMAQLAKDQVKLAKLRGGNSSFLASPAMALNKGVLKTLRLAKLQAVLVKF